MVPMFYFLHVFGVFHSIRAIPARFNWLCPSLAPSYLWAWATSGNGRVSWRIAGYSYAESWISPAIMVFCYKLVIESEFSDALQVYRGQVYQHNCFSTKSNSNKIRESLRSKKTCMSSYKFDECMIPSNLFLKYLASPWFRPISMYLCLSSFVIHSL